MGQNTEELRRDIEDTRDHLGGTFEAIGDRISPSRMMERRKNRITSSVRRVRDRVMGIGSSATHAISEGSHHAATAAKDGVEGTAGFAIEALKSAPQSATSHAQGSPLAAGAIAFGVGFVAAAVIPASSAETKAAGGFASRVEPMKEQLSSAARDVADHLKEPAREAVDSVKEVASEGTHSVKEAAKEAVQSTKDDAAGVVSDNAGPSAV